MEKNSAIMERDDVIELPPGFRFHPTDEELISHYLCRKVVDRDFSAIVIGEVDMNQVEPWELPWRAEFGEREWYFFCVRDMKYPTGLRTNRATATGYWKATGKDKEIFRGEILVGMKKTLVFYGGRAPKGVKSNWVCHEYRLVGELRRDKADKNDWVISRVFHKNSGGKKVHISRLMRVGSTSTGNEVAAAAAPPLMGTSDSGDVNCFSNNIHAAPAKMEENLIMPSSSSSAFSWGQWPPAETGNRPFPASVRLDDPSIFRTFSADMNHVFMNMKEFMSSVSQESNGNSSVVSDFDTAGKRRFEEEENRVEPDQDLVCIWSY